MLLLEDKHRPGRNYIITYIIASYGCTARLHRVKAVSGRFSSTGNLCRSRAFDGDQSRRSSYYDRCVVSHGAGSSNFHLDRSRQ